MSQKTENLLSSSFPLFRPFPSRERSDLPACGSNWECEQKDFPTTPPLSFSLASSTGPNLCLRVLFVVILSSCALKQSGSSVSGISLSSSISTRACVKCTCLLLHMMSPRPNCLMWIGAYIFLQFFCLLLTVIIGTACTVQSSQVPPLLFLSC